MKKKPQPPLKDTVAANLRSSRLRAGLSQVQLASATKLSSRYISIAESGQRNFRLDTLERLAAALDVTVCDLICDSRRTSTKKDAVALVISILQKLHEKL